MKKYFQILKFCVLKVTEVLIPLQSGFKISGKWWGDVNIQPILCLHGWQDNAGSYDRLIPLLPKNYSYLAIDFLGHGKSSWLPNGIPYNPTDFTIHIIEIMNYYKWNTISLMAHSLGSAIATLFAAVFPERINLLIIVDGFKIFDRSVSEQLGDIKSAYLSFLISDERIRINSKPPTYTFDEVVDKMSEGSFGNISKEAAPYLLKRNLKESSDGKYYFSRDGRLRNIILVEIFKEHAMYAGPLFKFPFLFLSANDTPIYSKYKNFDEYIEAFSKNEKFQLEIIDSNSHYFHLCEPEKISNIVGKFITNSMKTKSHL
jgi:pimeloyl-ACP methyl ester carboxylesterase